MSNFAVMRKPANPVHQPHDGFLDAVLEGAIDCIIIISSNGTIQRFNKAAAKLFGYTPSEIVGKNVNLLMPSPYHEKHDGYLQKYIDTNVPAIIGIGREVEGVKKDGTVIPVRLAVSEVIIDDQRFFTGVLHDLTDLKEREREILELTQELERKVRERTDELQLAINKLLQINKQLEYEAQERKTVETALRRSQKDLKSALEKEKELSGMKSRFVSTASHEFRTPLSTIMSSASLVAKYTEATQQPNREKHIHRIRASVNMLTRILDDFLSLSKLEQGEVIMKHENIVLGQFLRAVKDEMEGFLKDGQQIILQDETGGRTMQSDVSVLRNILYNLLTNASKYSEAGEILCHARVHDSQLIIGITDHGVGIPLDEQKHLFQRFYRAYNVTNIQGTGLGLYIVSNYLKLLQGTIEFQSTEGKGSTFTVSIPIDDTSEK